MPRGNRDFSRQRSSANNLRRNILITAGLCAAAVVIVVIAIVANSSAHSFTAGGGASFPAREIGLASAKIVMEEFADFQCPICDGFHSKAETRLREQYIKTGKVRFIFYDFPVVDSHVAGGNESHLAALAALCAGDQGVFWKYHDLLFQNQSGKNRGAFSAPGLIPLLLSCIRTASLSTNAWAIRRMRTFSTGISGWDSNPASTEPRRSS